MTDLILMYAAAGAIYAAQATLNFFVGWNIYLIVSKFWRWVRD